MANLNSSTQHKGKSVIPEDEINSVSNKGEDTSNILEMREGNKIVETSEYEDNEGEGDEEGDKEEVEDNSKSNEEGVDGGTSVPYQMERPFNLVYTIDTLTRGQSPIRTSPELSSEEQNRVDIALASNLRDLEELLKPSTLVIVRLKQSFLHCFPFPQSKLRKKTTKNPKVKKRQEKKRPRLIEERSNEPFNYPQRVQGESRGSPLPHLTIPDSHTFHSLHPSPSLVIPPNISLPAS
ncbi:hypothetical protein OWV82_006675 [Melia azedarach]|uniref:Uncharacterized protein n=1 Tax=Melia azedarach TaxID=155640 RepID=A0ACC1YJG4_MELAZ|nr:hypothetical protein OWV82_006675 [Melia azedarach]